MRLSARANRDARPLSAFKVKRSSRREATTLCAKNGPEHLQQAEAERNLSITLGASRVRMAIIEERALLARKLDPSK
jgi:hypothetical protein